MIMAISGVHCLKEYHYQLNQMNGPISHKIHVSVLVVPQLETWSTSHIRQLLMYTQTKVSEDFSSADWVLKAILHCTWTDELTPPTADPRAIAKMDSTRHRLVRCWSGKVTTIP